MRKGLTLLLLERVDWLEAEEKKTTMQVALEEAEVVAMKKTAALEVEADEEMQRLEAQVAAAVEEGAEMQNDQPAVVVAEASLPPQAPLPVPRRRHLSQPLTAAHRSASSVARPPQVASCAS